LNPLAETTIKNTFFVAMLLGTILNTSIIIAFFFQKVMLTTQNVLILNLSAADLLLIMFHMPITLVDVINIYWDTDSTFGLELTCQLKGFVQTALVTFSSFSTLMIAYDRYRIIVWPDHRQISVSMAFSSSVVMLIISSITAAPRIIITELVMEDWSDDYRNDTVLFCFEDWSDDIYLVYNCFTTIIQFILPLFGIIFLYTKIWLFLRSNTNLEYLTKMSRIRRMARMKRTNNMLIAVSIMFLISLLPVHVFTFSLNFIQLETFDQSDVHILLVIFSVFHLLAMTSVITNPIMYGLLNFSYQKNLVGLFSRCTAHFRRSTCRQNMSLEMRSL